MKSVDGDVVVGVVAEIDVIEPAKFFWAERRSEVFQGNVDRLIDDVVLNLSHSNLWGDEIRHEAGDVRNLVVFEGFKEWGY